MPQGLGVADTGLGGGKGGACFRNQARREDAGEKFRDHRRLRVGDGFIPLSCADARPATVASAVVIGRASGVSAPSVRNVRRHRALSPDGEQATMSTLLIILLVLLL